MATWRVGRNRTTGQLPRDDGNGDDFTARRTRGTLHAVARGGTLTRRQPFPARWFHQSLGHHHNGRPRAGRPRGRRVQQRVAARLRGEVRGPQARATAAPGRGGTVCLLYTSPS